ncbi:MAG: hypothetical protein ACI396_05365 [Acutalibacteraceae bacterium]
MSEKSKKSSKNVLIVIICVLLIAAAAVAVVVIKNNAPHYDNAVVTTAAVSTQPAATTAMQGNITVNMPDEAKALSDFNAEDFVKLAYEMKNQFAFEAFDTPANASVSKLTQFAFCHIYSNTASLTDYDPLNRNVYRAASESNIKTQMNKLLEDTEKIDIKGSDLYNKQDNIFEMWQPNYKTDVFARCTVHKNGDLIELQCVFYSDSEKTEQFSQATLTVRYYNGDNSTPAGYRIVSFK